MCGGLSAAPPVTDCTTPMHYRSSAPTRLVVIHLQKILHMKCIPFGVFAEIMFPKNVLEDGVSGVRCLDVVAPNLFLQDHV
jgi:hypothetical protein